jgi:transglutaminase-like putative cysteine protease
VSQVSSEAVRGELARWLRPTRFIDSDHAEVAAYARQAVGAATDPREKAVILYYAVRDDFRYDPYRVEMSEAHFRASACIERGYGFCITKAVLLAAALRAEGVPARLGFGDVRNHLATKRLIELNNGDVFYFHGYTDVLVDGRWVKATPAFNVELCEKFGVMPLEFDGRQDSAFHPFDKSGRRHMEYVNERGAYDDLPFDEIRRTFLAKCPAVVSARGGDFADEALRERGAG